MRQDYVMPHALDHAPPRDGWPAVHRSRHELSVVTPYRLDLTVSALRRLSMNIIDVLTPEGQYVRALGTAHGPVVVHVVQRSPERLIVTIDGHADEHVSALALVRQMLAMDCDLTHFDGAAARVRWLRALALRLRGLKPPRYPTLWEAIVNAVAFQQLSLKAASTITRRVILALGTPIECQGMPLYIFPRPEEVLGAEDRVLRAAGLSAGKIATLRRAGEALLSGAVDRAQLDWRSSADATAWLQTIKGIGPWTATVILLRGLGRLDVFPKNDTSVAQNIALVGGAGPLDVARALETLRPQQGMLYFQLLLARLEARDEVGRPSASGCAARQSA